MPLNKSQLVKIRGITPARADALIAAGINTKAKLKKNINKLPVDARIALLYPLCTKIRHDIATIMLSRFPRGIIVAGSYRRRKPVLKDLDLLTTDPLDRALKKIKARGQRTGGYKIAEEVRRGETKMTILIDFIDLPCRFVLCDVTHVKTTDLPFALLHHTGSQQFNIRVRAVAKRRGYKLNQYGLFRISDGKKLKFKSEREILDFLGVTYKEPWERSE